MRLKALHIIFCLSAFFLQQKIALASVIPSPNISSPIIKIIENKGQWEKEVLFKANIPGGNLFITKSSLVYALIDEHALHQTVHEGAANTAINGHNYKVMFEGSTGAQNVLRENPSTETYNYFIGNDAAKWGSSCRAFEKITLQNIYPQIDIEIIAKQDFIKLNFIVKPGGNPDNIMLKYEGADSLMLKNGAIHIQTTVAEILEEKPYSYQQNEVLSEYVIEHSTVSFKIGTYNKSEILTIDPNIVFGTYSGSVADNFGFTGTYDANGNGYTGGTVFSQGFPVTMGAYQQLFAGGVGYARDVGILKFSADGTQLLYATYFGGTNNEQPHSIICNATGELYILGTTESTNIPVTANAVDKFNGGKADIFIAHLSADGTSLLASTYWGGSQDDGINGTNHEVYSYNLTASPLAYNYGDFYRGEIKLDASGNVVVVSSTQSTVADGYTILNGFQSTFGGGHQDGCIFKLTPNLSTILFSSYLGGNGDDAIYGVTFDSFNNIWVTGGTTSNNIGKNQGNLTYNGGIDGFVGKISALGISIQKLVYIGTSAYDQSYIIETDLSNNIYITGQTLGAYSTKGNVYSQFNGHNFISILNNNLDSILYSTVIGNGASGVTLSPSGFMVDNCGKVYLTGWGGNTNIQFQSAASNTLHLATTSNAFQPLSDGSDFYLIVLAKNLAQLKYATYIGGNRSADHVDGGTSRFDRNGTIYQAICASCGGTSDLPTTVGAYSRTNQGKRPNSNAGGCNNALVKFNADPSDRAPIVRDTFLYLTAGDSISYQFTITDPDGDSVYADFASTLFQLQGNPAHITTIVSASSITAILKWKTLCANASSDTFAIAITAHDNGCFISKTTYATIKLLVNAPPLLEPPYPECLQTINDSTVKIKWLTPTNINSFKKYTLYKKIGANPYQLMLDDSNALDSFVFDSKATNHLTQNICYYIKTTNSCDDASIPSREICSLFLPSLDTIFNLTIDTTLYLTATDTLDYTFVATSVNPQDSLFLNSVSGTLLSTNRVFYSSISNTIQQASYHFKWASICDDKDTFTVTILLRDNQCPQSRTQYATIKIVVLPPPIIPAPVMHCVRNINKQSTLVRWDAPATASKYFSHYVLLKILPNGNYIELTKVFTPNGFSYTDNDAPNNEINNICYTAYAVTICNTNGDTATPTCSLNKGTSAPPALYIYTTTVQNNKEIYTTWQKSTELDFWKYKVYKRETNGTNTPILAKETNNINDTLFTDETVNVQKSVYCYTVNQINDCGISNENDYVSCSILLTGKSVPFSNNLNWNDYDYWKQGLNKYTINRSEPNIVASAIGQQGYKFVKLTDNKLNKENGMYNYSVVASEINSPFTSTSNTIELIQSPVVYAPNAFTPNNDNINDSWLPSSAFVKDYTLKIFNRWGQLVFETTDKKQGFNGLFDQTPTTADVFVYVITYTGWDNSSHTLNGNLTQLK